MKKKTTLYIIAFTLSIILFLLSMSFFGVEGFKWFEGFTWSTDKAKNSVSIATLAYMVVGIGLSVSGVAMQCITRNALASSYSLGTVAAASLSIIIASYVLKIKDGHWIIMTTILFTILISSTFLISVFTSKISPSKIIVIGIMISVFLSSITYILKIKYNLTSKMISFLSVDQNIATWKGFFITAPIIIFGSVLLLFLGKKINIYKIDPEKAKTLGIKIKNLKIIISVIVIVITASAVYLVGTISFIGILVPHLSRMILRNNFTTRKVMLISIPISIIVLLSSQMITRELYRLGFNINVIIAAVAGPFIIYKIIRSNHV